MELRAVREFKDTTVSCNEQVGEQASLAQHYDTCLELSPCPSTQHKRAYPCNPTCGLVYIPWTPSLALCLRLRLCARQLGAENGARVENRASGGSWRRVVHAERCDESDQRLYSGEGVQCCRRFCCYCTLFVPFLPACDKWAHNEPFLATATASETIENEGYHIIDLPFSMGSLYRPCVAMFPLVLHTTLPGPGIGYRTHLSVHTARSCAFAMRCVQAKCLNEPSLLCWRRSHRNHA